MAWWDHEELKDKRYRSDRYRVAFPDQYTEAEVKAALLRIEQQEANKKLQVPDFDLYKINDGK